MVVAKCPVRTRFTTSATPGSDDLSVATNKEIWVRSSSPGAKIPPSFGTAIGLSASVGIVHLLGRERASLDSEARVRLSADGVRRYMGRRGIFRDVHAMRWHD